MSSDSTVGADDLPQATLQTRITHGGKNDMLEENKGMKEPASTKSSKGRQDKKTNGEKSGQAEAAPAAPAAQMRGFLSSLIPVNWSSSTSKKSCVTEDEAEQPDEKVTRTQTRHYGLYNQGATCYLNSVLQVLSMTTEIHDRLDPKSQTTDKELKILFKKLQDTTCGTENITKSLGIEDVNVQLTAAECLEMILRKISPKASEVFEGELTHTTKCSKCHKINEETKAFWTLALSLKDSHDPSYSVERSFERIFKSKSFNGGNLVYCNDCKKKTKAERGCEMVFPQILTLLLKRFDFDNNTGTYFKSDRCVDVPRELQRNDKKYELYAMVNHIGGLRGGRYTATILSNEDNTWYEFNDSQVYKVKEPFTETNSYNSRTVYLLMYREQKRGYLSSLIPWNWSYFSSKTDDAAEQPDEKGENPRPGQRAHWTK